MSLRDTNKIDLVAKNPEGGFTLFVLDLDHIADEQQRHYQLGQKLICYADYVASGQYREQAPAATPDTLTIRVICQEPPNASMQQITAIATREEPIIRLPVVFELNSDFRARAAKNQSNETTNKTRKPWWRFW